DRVVVAVSGGPDSMALLDVLVSLRAELGLWLCVAHLNHGLREAAAADAECVAARAAELGVPFHGGACDVLAEQDAHGGSIEMAARRVRYAFLGQVAAETRANRIATGHTADDQVETVVLGLLRSGSPECIAGMPAARPLEPGSEVTVVRPLLDATRDDVLHHMARRGLAYCEDETNADTTFARNAVRHHLLPLLSGPDGKFRQDVLRAAKRMRQLLDVMDATADSVVRGRDGRARVAVASVHALHGLGLGRVVRKAFAIVGGRGEVVLAAMHGVAALCEGGSGREAHLPDGVVVRREYGDLVFLKQQPTAGAPLPHRGEALRRPLPVPGQVAAPEGGLRLSAEAVERGPSRPVADDPWEEVVDLDKVGGPLVVRRREAGDRFQPLGLGGTKKLKDYFIDQHVPRDTRDEALVVEGPHGIVWVVGHRLDDRAKVTPATRHFARLSAAPLGDSTRRNA
ncbi:tRNA lysidine(34) synthetase TilS, partial [bacterium]|nr:tRNA lysidine(34) synthetase TilS [bacterium]